MGMSTHADHLRSLQTAHMMHTDHLVAASCVIQQGLLHHHALLHMVGCVQEKFDERWQALLLPKLAEEDMHARTDEAAVRKQRLEKAQVLCWCGLLNNHPLL